MIQALVLMLMTGAHAHERAYTLLDQVVGSGITTEFTYRRERLARELDKNRYGHVAPSDQSAWRSLHPDFRELIARNEARDRAIDQRVRTLWNDVKKPAKRSFAEREVDLALRILRVPESTAVRLRPRLMRLSLSRRALEPQERDRVIRLDAEMLARTIERLWDAAPAEVEARLEDAVKLTLHAYVTMGARHQSALIARVAWLMTFNRDLRDEARFWREVRRNLDVSIKGRAITEFDDQSFEVTGEVRSANDPKVIVARVTHWLRQQGSVIAACQRALDHESPKAK